MPMSCGDACHASSVPCPFRLSAPAPHNCWLPKACGHAEMITLTLTGASAYLGTCLFGLGCLLWLVRMFAEWLGVWASPSRSARELPPLMLLGLLTPAAFSGVCFRSGFSACAFGAALRPGGPGVLGLRAVAAAGGS